MVAQASPLARAEESRIDRTNYWRHGMATNWTPERRARQAALIRTWCPQQSTGPKSPAGKAVSAKNAFKVVAGAELQAPTRP